MASFILDGDDAVIVRAQGGKHVYNSEIWEKAFFEGLEQRATALDTARVSAPTRLALSSSQYHLGGLRDALAQMSFTLMAVLTEVAAEHDLSLTQPRGLVTKTADPHDGRSVRVTLGPPSP